MAEPWDDCIFAYLLDPHKFQPSMGISPGQIPNPKSPQLLSGQLCFPKKFRLKDEIARSQFLRFVWMFFCGVFCQSIIFFPPVMG